MRSFLALTSICGLFLGAGFGAHRARGAEDRVQLTMKGNSLDITVAGQPFAVYHFGKTQQKPYFWPVRGRSGDILTRPLEKPKDHPHHKGLWFSVDEVNGIRFWAEKGKIENVSVEPIIAEGDPARFKVVNHWLGKDGQTLLTETTTISIFSNRLIAYDAKLTAGKTPVTFHDTKEGLFGFRMVDTLREYSMTGKQPNLQAKSLPARTGSVVNAEGVRGTGANWGKTAEWIDYSGELNGKRVGIAIFDNPRNFRPSRYHVRDYGLFSISPFGEHAYTNGKSPAAPVELKPGQSLKLSYAIYIHPGDTQTGKVAETYKWYLAYSDYERNQNRQTVTANHTELTPPPASLAPAATSAPATVTAPNAAPLAAPAAVWVYERHHHHRCCYICVPQECAPTCQGDSAPCR